MAEKTEEAKERSRAAIRAHYRANKEQYLARNRRRKIEFWERFESIRAVAACIRCGNNHPAVLDYHHRDPSQKTANIGALLSSCGSWQKVLDEIAKCDVLCANCHRMLHWELRQNKPS